MLTQEKFWERLEDEADELTMAQHGARYKFASNLVWDKALVLDIAAGTGYGSSLLKDAGAGTVVAGDVSKSALSSGHRADGERVQFLECDAQNLPLRSDSFEAIISFETIEHLTQPERFLQECRRVLTPDGILIISTPNRGVSSPHSSRPLNPFHVKEFWPWEFQRMLERYFDVVSLLGQVPSRRGRLLPFAAFLLGKIGALRPILEMLARVRRRASSPQLDAIGEDLDFNVEPFSWGLLKGHAYMIAVCRKTSDIFSKGDDKYDS